VARVEPPLEPPVEAHGPFWDETPVRHDAPPADTERAAEVIPEVISMPAPAAEAPKAFPPEHRAKPGEATPPAASGFELDLLIGRLREGGMGAAGHRVVVVETSETGDESLAQTLAATLSASGDRALLVDLNGLGDDLDEPGLTDLVAGEVAFLDAIQPIPGSRLHVIARGSIATEILIEEPQALSITLDALDEAYAWVICRLDAARAGPAPEILSGCIGSTTAVVIASNAEADDVELVALYGRAEDAGAALVLVAQDRPAIAAEPEMLLRLSAA
jgi:hypothetical protein